MTWALIGEVNMCIMSRQIYQGQPQQLRSGVWMDASGQVGEGDESCTVAPDFGECWLQAYRTTFGSSFYVEPVEPVEPEIHTSRTHVQIGESITLDPERALALARKLERWGSNPTNTVSKADQRRDSEADYRMFLWLQSFGARGTQPVYVDQTTPKTPKGESL